MALFLWLLVCSGLPLSVFMYFVTLYFASVYCFVYLRFITLCFAWCALDCFGFGSFYVVRGVFELRFLARSYETCENINKSFARSFEFCSPSHSVSVSLFAFLFLVGSLFLIPVSWFVCLNCWGRALFCFAISSFSFLSFLFTCTTGCSFSLSLSLCVFVVLFTCPCLILLGCWSEFLLVLFVLNVFVQNLP